MNTTSENFNMEMNVIKALGIIAIVAGHANFSVLTQFFPAYSYHLSIFFFVSGYLIKETYIDNIFEYIKKKFKSLIVLYFIYNSIYALITYIVYKINGQIVGNLPNLKNFFIQPFFNGHQYLLDCALWFVPQLFISLITFVILYKVFKILIKKDRLIFISFLSITLLSIFLSGNNYEKFDQSLGLIAFRTMFSLFFIYLGFIYKLKIEDKYAKKIFSLNLLPFIFLIQAICWLIPSKPFDKGSTILDYIIIWNYFPNKITPIITSFTGIWLTIFIAKLITPYVKPGCFLDKIGRNTFHIMANHLFVFYIISTIFLSLNHISLYTLKAYDYVYYIYKPEKYIFFYIIISFTLTSIFAIFIKNIKNNFLNLYKKRGC